MKRLIFTLAGVSLLDEEKKLLGVGNNFKENLCEIRKHQNIEVIIKENKILKELKIQVLNALKGKKLRDELTDFSAEVASLYKLQALDNEGDKVMLIVSETPECAFSGIVNGKFIVYRRTNDQNWDSITFQKSNGVFSCGNVEIKIIAGLQVKNGRAFVSKGIKNLFTFVSNKIDNEGASYDEVIFNITGGYKGTIPYLTLFGMLYQEREIKDKKIKPLIKYLYEESEDIITLPNLPIAFDLFTWRNYRGFIETISYLNKSIAELFLNTILPPQINGLFEIEKAKDKYILTILGGILKGKYGEEKEGELTQYGRGYLLTEKIDRTKRKILRKCIDRWQYLWIGDRIPETVEHARGHTQRVLELTAQMLYPILNKEESFFGNKDETDNNLLVLISSIWLHDLGHSGDYLKWQNENKTQPIEFDIKGFPSLVRDIHHLLTWYLMDKEKKELFNSSIFTNLIEPIRQISLYNRYKMPVSQCEKYEFIGIMVGKPLKSLQCDLVNLPLLGALLRIADAGDVQRERTISPRYEAMRRLQDKIEIERLEEEEKGYREMVNALFNGNSKLDLPDYLKYLKEIAKKYFKECELEFNNDFKRFTEINEKKEKELKKLKKEAPHYYNDALFDYLVDKCVQNFIQNKKIKNIDSKKKVILRNWLSALNQYIFKKRQPFHFEKHKGVSAVMYLLDKTDGNNGNNKYHFKVLAIHKKGENGKETKKLIENAEQVVLKDIYKEYEKVKSILNAHRIFFDSYYRMEEGSRQMIPVKDF